MASVAVETTADTSAATSAVHPPLAPAPPPIPPPRSLLNRNTEIEKSLSETSKSNNTDILAMATKPETSTTVPSHTNASSTPSPPPPPADFQAITSPLPPDLPPPPEFYTSSSPPPPPPPPSYLFPELSLEDLPPPPPPQLFMDMESQHLPMYICSYDPPSPEIKSEYDPKLPPGFSVKYRQNPFSPSPPPVPPPPRPTPPPPPTPPVRQGSKENLAIPAHTSANDETLSTQTVTNASSSDLYLASGEDTQTKDSLDGTSCNYPRKTATDTHMSTDDSVYGRPVSSGLSSSTLTASLLVTPESGLSPLPPHALRVSPVPTDVNTPNSSQVTDDLTITSASSDTASTPYIFDSRDSTFDIDTPEVTPQLSEILGIHSPTPNEVKMNSIMDEILAGKDSLSDVTPQLSEVSGTSSPTPTEEEVNSVGIEIKIDSETVPSPEQAPSPIMLSEISTASGPDSSESERNEYSTGIDSTSEQTDYSLTEKADTDIVGGSLTVTSTTGVAHMSSPFSTEPPSLFSLPTDSDTISADFDSLAADTLSPTADFESYSGDAETSTINSIAITRAADMFLTSSSGFSDTAYATADSNMESATMSPAFTESCTITPMPSDFLTPMSTNPNTTPVPSPIPSSPLPYFDAIPPEAMSLSQYSSINPSLSAMVTSSSSRMVVSSSEHHTEFQSKISNTQKRLVTPQLSDPPLDQDDKNVSSQTLSGIAQQTSTNNEELLVEDEKIKQNLNSNNVKSMNGDTQQQKVDVNGTQNSEKKVDLVSPDDITCNLQDKSPAMEEKCDSDADTKPSEYIIATEEPKVISLEEVEDKVMSNVKDVIMIDNKSSECHSTNSDTEKNEKEESPIPEKAQNVEDLKPSLETGMDEPALNTCNEIDKINSLCQEESCKVEPENTTNEAQLETSENELREPEIVEGTISSNQNLPDEKRIKENELRDPEIVEGTISSNQNLPDERRIKENELTSSEEITGEVLLQTENLQYENGKVVTETDVKNETSETSKNKASNEDILTNEENMSICKEQIDEEKLSIQSKESVHEDGKYEEKEDSQGKYEEKEDSQGKYEEKEDSQILSPSPVFLFDFSDDDCRSPSHDLNKSTPTSPSLAKIRSYSSSPISGSSAKKTISPKFSPCGGSMSPRTPVSPAKSPISNIHGTDTPASPNSHNIFPFSKSPEEAMELLDTIVGNMETMSADLPPQPSIKEKILEESISTPTTIVCDKKESPDSETLPLESKASEHYPQVLKDTECSECKVEDSDPVCLSATSAEEGAITDPLLFSSSPTSPVGRDPETAPHTPLDSLTLSSDVKEYSQSDNKDSSTDHSSPIHMHPSDNVMSNVLSTCATSDVELTSSHHNSQMLHATNIEIKENLMEGIERMSDESVVNSMVTDKNEINLNPNTLLSAESKSKDDDDIVDFESTNLNPSEMRTDLEKKETECAHTNLLDSQKDNLDSISNVENVQALTSSGSPTSLSSSLHSILEDVVQPLPASRAKTPPLPPPRSCMNTPRPGVGAPLPPPRQYMLIPINSSQRRHSPPPAPPRSTSIRKSPPPPPPRSAIHTPAAKNEWIDFPPLPPPPTSAINTPSTPPKLTPVPEESSFPCTPLPPKDSQQESSLLNATPSPTYNKSPCWTVPVSECDNALTSAWTPTCLELSSLGEENFFNRSLNQPTVESEFSTAVIESLSSIRSISNTPPPLPPMPEEDTEEEPPPPPPPPVEFEDEHVPPLPLPPPPESLISLPPAPPPPTRSKIATPPLPPKIVFSPEVCSLKKPLSASNSLENANQSSIPLASDTATSSSDPPAMSLPAASPATEAQGVPVELAPIMSSSAPSLVPPPPPPPQMPVLSSSQIPSHPPLPGPPPPRCPAPQSSKATPNSDIWTVSPYGKVIINRNDLPLPSPEEEIRKTFYNVKNWGLLGYDMNTFAVYTQLRPNIQMGPQCGLVALSMASQVFPETKEIGDLLKDARQQKFTSHGEMFSCENMAKLANGISGMEATVRRDVLCDSKTLLELLIHGNLILVPYDAEQNHTPYLRNGHKAHWGIICGCLVQCESLSMHMGGTSKLDARIDNLWHMRPRSRRGVAASRDGSLTPSTPIIPSSPRLGQRIPRTPEIPASSLPSDNLKTPDTSFPEISTGRTTEMDTLSVCSSRVNTPMIPEILNDDIRMVVLWRQGKSRSLIASSIEKLCESNDQLLEYPPPSNEVEREFIIGSVQDGLAGQVVVLHKTKTALSDLVGILQDKEECI